MAKGLASLTSDCIHFRNEPCSACHEGRETRKLTSRAPLFYQILSVFSDGPLGKAAEKIALVRLAKKQRLWSVPGILNDDECAHIISIFRGHMKPSGTAINFGSGGATSVRTSSTAFVPNHYLQENKVFRNFVVNNYLIL